MSAENPRLRFFGTSRRVGRQAASWVPAPCRHGHLAPVALHGERIIGVAEYEVTSAPTVAEVAPAVADDFPHRSAGTLLADHSARHDPHLRRLR